MWLLKTDSLELEEFPEEQAPPYAILSHTWDGGEVTFQDMQGPASARSVKPGYRKIAYSCEEAQKRSLQYVWVDTCCINKGSSAELSESINSMFRWYAKASVCFAYLADLPRVKFPSSRWFTRGWTLQELLAPPELEFFTSDWISLGTRLDRAHEISSITGIGEKFLNPKSQTAPKTHYDDIKDLLMQASIAQRMSWAANRQTTRVEDMAYCLLGLFGINIPLLYGEGAEAFIRLQEAILQRVHDDQSIFAWKVDKLTRTESILALATSPKAFSECGSVVACRMDGYDPELRFSNKGIQLNMPVSSYGDYIALRCQHEDSPSNVLAIPVRFSPGRICFRARGDIKSASHTACSQLPVTPIYIPMYPMQLRKSQNLPDMPRVIIRADTRHFALSREASQLQSKLSTGIILPPDKVVSRSMSGLKSGFDMMVQTTKIDLESSFGPSAHVFTGTLVCRVEALSMRSSTLQNPPAIPLRLTCILERTSKTGSAKQSAPTLFQAQGAGHVFVDGRVIFAASRAESVFGKITNVVEIKVSSNPLDMLWFLISGWATRLFGRRITRVPVGLYTYAVTNLYAFPNGEMPFLTGCAYLWSFISLFRSMWFNGGQLSGQPTPEPPFMDITTAGPVIKRLIDSIHPGQLFLYVRMIPLLASMASFDRAQSQNPPPLLEYATFILSTAMSVFISPQYMVSLSEGGRPLYIKVFPLGLFLFWLNRVYRLRSREVFWETPDPAQGIWFLRGLAWMAGVGSLWCWAATEFGWTRALHWSVLAVRVPLEAFLFMLLLTWIPSLTRLWSFLKELLQ